MAQAVLDAASWDARVQAVRRVPEEFGDAHRPGVYARIAERVYVPHLKPDFAYIHWRPEYELGRVEAAYDAARTATDDFARVSVADLAAAVRAAPSALLVFRLIVGLTSSEFAESAALIAASPGASPPSAVGMSKARVEAIEAGRVPTPIEADLCAAVIGALMSGALFPPPPGGTLRLKLDKPDTVQGWDSVRQFATEGVPFPILLHQRLYGGAFRQLLDATSTQRGDLLEEPVEELFRSAGIPFVRTGSHNQGEIEDRFGLTVRPAPDFLVYEVGSDALKAMLEVKGANDGGTARDKAGRFGTLRREAERLGGVPLFAVLAGTGWRRTQDALGPVIRATDGRTFTPDTLPEMLQTQPFPSLLGHVAPDNGEVSGVEDDAGGAPRSGHAPRGRP